MTLFMETTQINAERTVNEIQGILSGHGATQILLDFVGKCFDIHMDTHNLQENS